jgi:hypothetical protein
MVVLTSLWLAHLARVTQGVKPDEPAHPVQISLLGAQAVVHVTQPLAQLVQQTLGLQRWPRGLVAGLEGVVIAVHNNNISDEANKINRFERSGAPCSSASGLVHKQLCRVSRRFSQQLNLVGVQDADINQALTKTFGRKT